MNLLIGMAVSLLALGAGTVRGTLTGGELPLDQPYVRAYCGLRADGLHEQVLEGEVERETGRFELSELPEDTPCELYGGSSELQGKVELSVGEGQTLETIIPIVPRNNAPPSAWSPLGLSLSSRLQFPRASSAAVAGLNLSLNVDLGRWRDPSQGARLRVYGFDLGLLSRVDDQGFGLQAGLGVRACGWVGVQVGLVASSREPEVGEAPGCIFGVAGVQLGGAWAYADVAIGLQLAAGMSKNFNVVGVQLAGLVAESHGAAGVQLGGLVALAEWPSGVQVGGVSSIARDRFEGVQLAGLVNVVEHYWARGLQIAPGLNYAPCLEGAQIGLINVAKRARGVQLGLINVIGRRVRPVLNLGRDHCAIW